MKLIIPTIAYEKELQAFRQEFLIHGGDMDGCLSLRRMDDIKEWLHQLEDCTRAETCLKRWVVQTQFIYVREEDRKVVGVIQVRHELNDFLKTYGGHIGYSICHSERKKGYATQMLKDVLPYCRELGFQKILITCLSDNEGSRRTIMNNGGVYESTVHEPEKNVELERYWITLES